MKKLFLAVVSVVVAFSASAQTFDFTNLYNVTPTVVGNQTYTADGGLGYSEIKAFVSATYGTATTYSSLPNAEIRLKHSTDATKSIRVYPSTDEQAGLFGNGGDGKITITGVTAGKYVHVYFMAKGSTTVDQAYLIQAAKVTSNMTAVNTATSTKPASGFAPVVEAVYSVTATGSIEIYITNSIIKTVVINDVPGSSSNAIASSLLSKVNQELVNPTNLEVEVYSVSGVKVLSSSAASISVSGLANGAYIAKTAEGTLKFVK